MVGSQKEFIQGGLKQPQPEDGYLAKIANGAQGEWIVKNITSDESKKMPDSSAGVKENPINALAAETLAKLQPIFTGSEDSFIVDQTALRQRQDMLVGLMREERGLDRDVANRLGTERDYFVEQAQSAKRIIDSRESSGWEADFLSEINDDAVNLINDAAKRVLDLAHKTQHRNNPDALSPQEKVVLMACLAFDVASGALKKDHERTTRGNLDERGIKQVTENRVKLMILARQALVDVDKMRFAQTIKSIVDSSSLDPEKKLERVSDSAKQPSSPPRGSSTPG